MSTRYIIRLGLSVIALFCGLKLNGAIDLSWWWIGAPLGIFVAFIVIGMVLALIAVAMAKS